ncbi:Os01g0539900, partial [Oryza sativa Japonica Group]
IGLVCLLLVFSCYNKSVKLNKLLLIQDILSSVTMNSIRTVASLDEVNGVLQEMGINAIGQAHQVQFCLHEQTSLKEATEIKVITRPGRHGFKLVNPELLNCKFKAKVKLDVCYKTMFNACMVQCDQELLPLEARIAQLKNLILSTDDQIPHRGPEVDQRNRGVQLMLYPEPPSMFIFVFFFYCVFLIFF